MARKGIWIVVEGCDGAGKSALSESLAVAFERSNRVVRRTSEPTSERYGRLFQTRMKNHLASLDDFSFEEQLQLLTRDRMIHTARISQWLADGAVVVQDRFWPSTVAYQGQTVDVVSLYQMHCWLFSPGPDIMVWLDTPMEHDVGGQRMSSLVSSAYEIYAWLNEQGDLFRVSGQLELERQVQQVMARLMVEG